MASFKSMVATYERMVRELDAAECAGLISEWEWNKASEDVAYYWRRLCEAYPAEVAAMLAEEQERDDEWIERLSTPNPFSEA